MSVPRWISALLLALAVVAGAAWWLQRQAAAQLREEVALLRDENRKIAQLRAENAKLVAAQAPPAELERLRSDRAAVVQLRGEIEKLKAGVDARERVLKSRADARAAVDRTDRPMIPASEWKNAGRATPVAAIETIFWLGARRDIDGLAPLLVFDAALKSQADAFFESLPEATRTQYGTVERLIAHFMTKDTPPAALRVVDEKKEDADHAQLGVQLQNQEGESNRVVPLLMQRSDDGWRMTVPRGLVRDIANKMGGGLQAAPR